MISILSLWLPILASAVAVFIVSSLIHMVFTYHRSDFSKLTVEDEFLDAVSPLGIAPGEYMFPFGSSPKDMAEDAYKAKLEKGPVGMMIVMPNGPFKMGASLVQWFVYSVVVGVFAAYIAVQSLGPGADYLQVMRIIGASAFGGYALALLQNAIWSKHSWSATLKFVFDGLVYALITGGVFGWLWPA